MRAGWVVVMVCLVVSMVPGVVRAIGNPQDQIDDYLAEVDLRLSPAEELALKREIVASGALDRLRMEGKSALTEEENRTYAHLTRPVRAKDEANPKGQRAIIEVYCHDVLPRETLEGLFSARGLIVLRSMHLGSKLYVWVEAQPGTDVIREAHALEAEGARLAEGMGLKNVYPVMAPVSNLLSDQVIGPDQPGLYIAKNRVGVHFIEPQSADAIRQLAKRENLVLQWPRVDLQCPDSSWTTGEASFFIADSATVGEVVDRLFNYSRVRYAKPDGWVTFDSYIPDRNDPNDDNYSSIPSSSQWYFLQNRSPDGADSNDDDSRDFDVDAPEGWHLQTGSAGTRVAVIDAGFDLDHTELASRWWVNPGETANGLDDDSNGYVDDIHGANLADPAAPIPDHYHGTMVAGLVGAATNNDDKVAGSNWGCKIVALRIEESPDQAAMNTQIRLGIEYAMAESVHANVINMSLRMTEADPLLEAAIASAYASGIVLVASSGNDHDDPNDLWFHYPADYDSVVEVAGTADDNRRYFTGTPPSTHGSGWGTGPRGPDLCAPGEDILVLTSGDAWTDGVSGTSLSAPIVAGLAALVMDQYGLHGQAEAVVRILKGAVDDVHGHVTDEQNASSDTCAGPDDLGAGRVNFLKALVPPRLQTVILTQGSYTRFNEGDLNGNGVFNWMDEDLDGDSYSNSDDNNDDADAQMDGDDTDDDGDGIHDSSDADVHALKTEIEAGEVDIKVLFNESMIVDGHGGEDPSVKLVMPDGSELVFASVGSGNDDWDTQWVANDLWHGRVAVTEDDIAKMYGDLRLEISGSADMAGEALDWDLETPGAQGYVYPLHMPGFVASASDPNAGVEKNTTAVGQGTWPTAWGVVDVVGRGFNTDASDPLSVQSMKVTIHKGYGNQTVVSGAPMTQTGRDFRYEWDTAAACGGVDTHRICHASCRHPAQMVGIWATKEGVRV